MIWAQGETCRVCCRQGGATGEDGDPPDGFPPFFSLLRLILPDQSLMPTPSAIPAGGAQVSHMLPGVDRAFSEQKAGTPGCVRVYRLHPGEPRVAFYHDHNPSHFKAINLF